MSDKSLVGHTKAAHDVTALLAAERQRGLKVSAIELSRAAIRYPHYLAGCPITTAEAIVGETLAGIHREPPQPWATAQTRRYDHRHGPRHPSRPPQAVHPLATPSDCSRALDLDAMIRIPLVSLKIHVQESCV
jgi:hypothetical protein